MAGRYRDSRYDGDRRSRSPRDRSPGRFDRAPPFADNDRRRSSAEGRTNSAAFQSNRDNFDPSRREPPRGPKALIDTPGGPRGGFSGDFRGSGRGRGGGRGRVWGPRDDSRERDIDFRGDRYRDERSRERDRDRDRDWRDRDNRDFRARRSPLRARSPPPLRDFRDRDRDGPLGVDADRARRDSRDNGPLSAGSSTSDPPYGGPPFARGGGMIRGRGRGGRGDWQSDRGRGRTPYDDRYPRSRSQEGRWGRDRDERDRGERYPDADVRRDLIRDERHPAERPDLIRPKLEQRFTMPTEPLTATKEVSPPPVAPSAPAFGSVPNRSTTTTDPSPTSNSGKAPPTGPKALSDRPGSAGHDAIVSPPTGPSRPTFPDNTTIPVGPRAQQQQKQRPSSKQWINPALKKPPESPKMMRAQASANSRSDAYRRGSSAQREFPSDEGRPRSSDAKSDTYVSGHGDRDRSFHSAEPGEIRSSVDKDEFPRRPSIDDTATHKEPQKEDEKMADVADFVVPPPDNARKPATVDKPTEFEPAATKTKRKRHRVGVVRFSLPTEAAIAEQGSESDDDEGLDDYFAMEIEKTQAELNKIDGPKVPVEVLRRYAVLTQGSMVKILKEKENLSDMLGNIPEAVKLPSKTVKQEQPATDAKTAEIGPEARPAEASKAKSTTSEAQPDADAMDVDAPAVKPLRVPSIREVRASSRGKTPRSAAGSEKASPAISHKERPTQLSAAPLESTEADSKPPSTPSQVEDDDSSTDDETYLMEVDNVRQYMATPPLDSLPDFGDEPWNKDQNFIASLGSDATVDDYVVAHLDQLHLERSKEQAELRSQYGDNYLHYLSFTTSEDPIAVKSRDKFSVSAPPVEPPAPVTPEPKPEGRGGGRRFATERDLERVLQASMREDEERKEREMRAQQEKYRSDKEAEIPPMIWDDEQRKETQFRDKSGYVPPERLVAAWQVLPPINNFTSEENDLFEKRYLEFPKQWGRVAEALPNRDFGSCIQYYYLMKKDLNLKEKLKKQPKRRKKGRKGGRSSALVSELGNGDAEGEENTETGENGERRRPRRAAAPVWPFEQPATDTENITPSGTPGRRGQSAKGDTGEKVDGRKGKRKVAKDKEPKLPKANQSLAATPGPTGRGRSRPPSRAQNPEGQPHIQEVQRLPTQFEQPPGVPAQGQFPPQTTMPPMDRQPSMPAPSMPDVMTAPPLRPEPPPPQPAMTTFNLAPVPQERKPPSQASSYWSVSESNDFPQLLRSFGSDWNAIAAHMGSKTSIMVKNYFVRQKDQGRADWENIVRQADLARARNEKLPEPPQPTATGRERRRYDGVPTNPGRPLAVAGGIELHGDPAQPPRMDPAAPPARGQPYSSFTPPMGQPGPQQPPPPGQQPPVSLPPHPAPQQPVSGAMSPGSRPLRAPLQGFGFPEREREPAQRQPLPLKGPVAALAGDREQRPLAAQSMPSAQPDNMMEREREAQHRMQQQRHHEREREMEMARQSERPPLRVKQEPDGLPHAQGFEGFGQRQQPGLAPASNREPLPLAGRPPQEPPRGPIPQSYPPPMQPQGGRGLLGNPSPAQSPPIHPPSRQGPPMHQGPPPGPGQDPYGSTPPQSAVSQAPPPAPRPPPEPRKTSSIMSLLNDDPPPAPKRVSEVNNAPVRPSPTPPPQNMGRQPPPGPGPQSHMRRDSDQYPPYGRSSGVSAMPSLKPTYSNSPQPHAMGGSRTPHGGPLDSPAPDRDYYRPSPYQPGHQSNGSTGSPQNPQRYPPPSQPPHYSQGGYPTTYAGSGPPPPHAASPPPQYPGHGSSSRSREVPQGRDSWQGQPPPQQQQQQQPPPSQQQQQAMQWQNGPPPPKTAQPPPQQSWAPQGPPTSKPPTPAGGWATAPPPHQPHHMGMRDDRGPPMYGGPGGPNMPPQQQGQQQHPMQGRYAQPPPTSRGPEPVPPPAQAYRGYGGTPGPGPGPGPRDPRDMPPRSYTPAGYDGRGPPPGPPQGQSQGPPPGPPGPGGYPPDPRDAQLRDSRDPRDPREMMARALRPHEYDRHPDQYRR